MEATDAERLDRAVAGNYEPSANAVTCSANNAEKSRRAVPSSNGGSPGEPQGRTYERTRPRTPHPEKPVHFFGEVFPSDEMHATIRRRSFRFIRELGRALTVSDVQDGESLFAQ